MITINNTFSVNKGVINQICMTDGRDLLKLLSDAIIRDKKRVNR